MMRTRTYVAKSTGNALRATLAANGIGSRIERGAGGSETVVAHVRGDGDGAPVTMTIRMRSAEGARLPFDGEGWVATFTDGLGRPLGRLRAEHGSPLAERVAASVRATYDRWWASDIDAEETRREVTR